MNRAILVLVGVVAATLVATMASCDLSGSSAGIVYMNMVVDVYAEGAVSPVDSRAVPRGRNNLKKVEDFEYEIRQVASVLPVEVGGQTVQANDVVIHDDIAVITYNTAGDPFVGAIQVIDVSSPTRPEITVEIGLPNSDVNAVLVTDTDIYIAGAANPDSIPGYDAGNPDRAFIARIARADLATVDGATIETGRVILDGFAATGIAEKDGDLFVSTGALNGELEILDSAARSRISDLRRGRRPSRSMTNDTRSLASLRAGLKLSTSRRTPHPESS